MLLDEGGNTNLTFKNIGFINGLEYMNEVLKNKINEYNEKVKEENVKEMANA